MNSQSARKFLLVDAADLKHNSFVNADVSKNNDYQQVERNKPLITKELFAVDKLMSEILNDNTLSEDEKVTAYNNALTNYQELKTTTYKKISSTRLPTLSKNSEPQLKEAESLTSYNPLLAIPQRFKTKASQLWDILKKDGKVSVNDAGRVTINGNQVLGSNLSDLLNLAVNSQLKGKTLEGWKEFRQVLIDYNVPKLLINQNVIEEKSKSRRESSKLSSGEWDPYDGKAKTKKAKSRLQLY